MATRIQLRRDTAAQWTANNPTLSTGEAGYESDTGRLKIGNGSSAWSSLAYVKTALTDTTGDYVATVSGTDGVTISGSGAGAAVTIANNDKGSSQNIFKNVAVSGQSTIVADSNDDTLTVVAGTGITLTTNATTDTLTVTNAGVTSVNDSTGAIANVALTSGKLSQFAATTSSELAGVISDETGTGALVFGTSPGITTSLTTPSTTFSLINTTATTVNFAGAATALEMGASSGTTTINNNLAVTGNLTINGTTTTVNSTTVTVDDPVITLGGDTAPTLDDNKDRGVEFRYFDTAARIGFMGWDDSAGVFVFLTNATNNNEVFSGTKGTIDANISGSNINSGTVSATYIDSAIARLVSPTFTGTPAAPTAAADTNTTQLATTAFVVGQAGSANPLANGTVAVGTSLRYARQDHVHPTTGLGLTSGKLSQFASTTSAEFAGVISDETGTGLLVFATSPTLTTPRISSNSSINDSNGNELIKFPSAVASAVNELNIINAATGQPVNITTSGDNADIALLVTTKGNGSIILDTGTGTGDVEIKPGSSNFRLYDDDSSHYYQFATGNRTANYTVTLPAASFTFAGINIAQTFTSTQTFSNATPITLSAVTSTVNFGNTGTRTVNLFTDATTTGNTKTINIGTAGASGSTTSINIGSAVSGATNNITANGAISGVTPTSPSHLATKEYVDANAGGGFDAFLLAGM